MASITNFIKPVYRSSPSPAEIAGYFFYMAETFYFSHDFGARNDPKLISLQMELGHEGKGIFWDLIEILYEQDGYILESELKSIAFALHTKYERITDVLTKYDLFVNEDGKYWSESVLRRLELRYSKSEKARNSVNKRWERLRKDTNVLPTQYEGNTIKESKVKEVNDNKVKDFETFWNLYDNKTDRKKCFDKWNKLKEYEIEKILATVADFKKHKPFPTYNHPNPLTYLNGQRWNDVLPSKQTLPVKEIRECDFFSRHEYETACKRAGIEPKPL